MEASTPGEGLWLLFLLAEQHFAIATAAVERVVRAVAVEPLPGAPRVVVGVVDVGDGVLPVTCLRRRFGLAEKPVEPSDEFIIAQTPQRRLLLIVDGIEGLIRSAPADMIAADHLVPSLGHLDGVFSSAQGIVFIYDIDRCLALAERGRVEAGVDGCLIERMKLAPLQRMHDRLATAIDAIERAAGPGN